MEPPLLSLTAGILCGLLAIAYSISFAALAYGGQPEIVARGIGLTLGGAVVLRVVVALTSSFPAMMSNPQDTPAAILALISAFIVSTIPNASTEVQFATMAMAVIICSLLIGICFLLLGYFKLGNLIRFLPYPVIGGFLAGTGWLLFLGGLGVMTGLSINWQTMTSLSEMSHIFHLLPGIVFALTLLVVLRRFSHFAIFPGLLFGGLILFYVVVWFSNSSLAEITAAGWLMGPFPSGNLWQPFQLTELGQVEWSLLATQSGNFITVVVISSVALLLNATGLELISSGRMDLNRELRAAGWANLATAVVAGLPGFQAFSLTALSYKIGNRGRLAALISAVVILFALLFGTAALALIPRFVIGGLVTFVGFSLIVEWIYEAWFKFSTIDYLIIVTILIVIATVGFLQGVALGTILALILFVVNYSRINVVKHALSGANYQSRVTRNQTQRHILDKEGAALFILELQGFIFFGTANNLLTQVTERLGTKGLPQLRFVLLDFRQVTGLDSTALLGFTKIKQLAKAQHIILLFTGLSSAIQDKMIRGGLTEEAGVLHFLKDLDHGLEWCENQILQTADVSLYREHDNLLAQLQALLPHATNLENLLQYFERLEVEEGYYLMKQGDQPDNLYFIEAGQVTAQLEYPNRAPLRLETMRGGRVVGEIGFYLNANRTAAVVTDEPSVIYRFSLNTLQEMEKSDPMAASTFHQIIVHLLSHRLTHLITTVEALQR